MKGRRERCRVTLPQGGEDDGVIRTHIICGKFLVAIYEARQGFLQLAGISDRDSIPVGGVRPVAGMRI